MAAVDPAGGAAVGVRAFAAAATMKAATEPAGGGGLLVGVLARAAEAAMKLARCSAAVCPVPAGDAGRSVS